MGRVILCNGKRAAQPHVFKSTGKKVFSIEELCYYFEHYINTLEEDIRDPLLIVFLREEILLVERANRFQTLLEGEADSKDLLACILYSSDYHTEEEIKEVLEKVDWFRQLPRNSRQKLYADTCLKSGQYQEAMKVYRSLLSSFDLSDLSDQEYGSVLHNIAVIQAKKGAFLSAEKYFFEAYGRNGSKESLRQCYFAWKLSGEAELPKALEEEIKKEFLLEDLQERCDAVERAAKVSEDFISVYHLKELKRQGKMKEYQNLLEETIGYLKRKYRQINS